MKILFTLVVIAAVFSAECNALSKKQLNDVKNILKRKLLKNQVHIPTNVRLAFHDCVSKTCDGCINLENASNNGLKDVIIFLEKIYKNNGCARYVSFADFVQIASLVSIELGIQLNNENCERLGSAAAADCMVSTDHGLTFRYGRTSCPTFPYTSDVFEFPASTMNWQEMMDYFKRTFGFTPREVSALLGAHTLGGAKKKNSGYSGSWVNGGENFWNNDYYKFLVASDFFFKNIPNACEDPKNMKWQWNLTSTKLTHVQAGVVRTIEERGFMLNTDMELYKNIDVNPVYGTFCNYLDGCELSETFESVLRYARDYNRWMENFVKVYEKMVSHGDDNLQVPH